MATGPCLGGAGCRAARPWGQHPTAPAFLGCRNRRHKRLLQQELRSQGRCGVGASICTHLSATRPAPLKSHFYLSGRHRQSAPRPAPVGQHRASAGRTFCCISIQGCPIPHSGWACDPGLAGQSLPLLTIARVRLESTLGHLVLGCDAGCPVHQRTSWPENKAILGGTKVPSS